MFYIALFIVILLFLAWMAMIYVRKSLWDGVHRNLLDMEDNFSGKIIRNGFASRPVFHGKIHEKDMTINFSSARVGKKRHNYIDFSLTTSSRLSLTIAEEEWLKAQDSGKLPEKVVHLQTDNGKSYIIQPANNSKVERIAAKEEFRKNLSQFENLAYFFVGKSGTICEFWSERLDQDTKFETMRKRINQIQLMLSILD